MPSDFVDLPDAPMEEEGASGSPSLSELVTAEILTVEPKTQKFSKEDILGNIDPWEKSRLVLLSRLRRMCERLKLEKAAEFFLEEKREILLLSRSVRGFQQKILRTTLTGKAEGEEKKGILDNIWRWR